VSGTSKIFGLRTLLDRLPSRVSLERRGVGMRSNLCPLSTKEVETIQHLLITCEVTQRLWVKCDNWLGISRWEALKLIVIFVRFP